MIKQTSSLQEKYEKEEKQIVNVTLSKWDIRQLLVIFSKPRGGSASINIHNELKEAFNESESK